MYTTPEELVAHLQSLPEPTEEELAYVTIFDDYAEEDNKTN